MGIPVEMFTVMFALGRLPGWIAQWREMLRKEPLVNLQIYTGSNLESLLFKPKINLKAYFYTSFFKFMSMLQLNK